MSVRHSTFSKQQLTLLAKQLQHLHYVTCITYCSLIHF